MDRVSDAGVSAQAWLAVHLLLTAGWWFYVFSTWVLISGLRVAERVERVCRVVRGELRPFALFLMVGMWVSDSMDGIPRPWWIMLGELFAWYVARRIDGDDDRWKRRRERLSARVAEVAGRLTVVPQT